MSYTKWVPKNYPHKNTYFVDNMSKSKTWNMILMDCIMLQFASNRTGYPVSRCPTPIINSVHVPILNDIVYIDVILWIIINFKHTRDLERKLRELDSNNTKIYSYDIYLSNYGKYEPKRIEYVDKSISPVEYYNELYAIYKSAIILPKYMILQSQYMGPIKLSIIPKSISNYNDIISMLSEYYESIRTNIKTKLQRNSDNDVELSCNYNNIDNLLEYYKKIYADLVTFEYLV